MRETIVISAVYSAYATILWMEILIFSRKGVSGDPRGDRFRSTAAIDCCCRCLADATYVTAE